MGKKTVKFFEPGKSLKWHKSDSQKVRRENALRTRRGDFLAAGKALLALSNVSRDSDTSRKAYQDAVYFFAQHKKRMALKAGRR
jgi:hypothetical protein